MREKIKLESSAGTGHFYTTTKNKRTMPDKIESAVVPPYTHRKLPMAAAVASVTGV